MAPGPATPRAERHLLCCVGGRSPAATTRQEPVPPRYRQMSVGPLGWHDAESVAEARTEAPGSVAAPRGQTPRSASRAAGWAPVAVAQASHGSGHRTVGEQEASVMASHTDWMPGLRLRGRRTTRKRGTSDLRLQRKIGQKGIRSAAVRQDFLEGNWLRFAPPSRRATPPRQPPSGGCACDRGVKSSAPRSRAAPARPGRRPRPPASVFWARARLVFASRLHSRR